MYCQLALLPIEENDLKKDLKDLTIHFSSEQIKMILHPKNWSKKTFITKSLQVNIIAIVN
jgi:hypothetical protein